MNQVATVCLPHLALWSDSTRIQTWPDLLARLDPNAMYASTRQLGRSHLSDRMTDKDHAAVDKVISNLPGLERRGDRLILRGVGLLEKHTDGYRLSALGRELRESYFGEPAGLSWVRLLSRTLLTREPRTRLLVRLLSEPDAELHFPIDRWWAGKMREVTIRYPDGRTIYPFVNEDPAGDNLRRTLEENSWWALGAWRGDSLLAGSTDCRFVGQRKEQLSLRDANLALRSACEVFLHLGVIRHSDGHCWIDHGIANRELGAELASDFGWRGNAPDAESSLLQRIIQLLDELRTDTGFVVASELRRRLQEQGVENPDREIGKLETAGRLILEAADYGQGRHGLGLYHDPGKQLIKLRVC